MNSQQYLERKTKLEENLAHVTIQFRKLHLIHDKVLEISNQTEDPTPQVDFMLDMFLNNLIKENIVPHFFFFFYASYQTYLSHSPVPLWNTADAGINF